MRPENESDQAIGILIATAANVSSWRIRLAAYVTRLERVRGSRPSWVQIPHPPPLEIPALKESGFSHFYTQNLSLKVPHWCSPHVLALGENPDFLLWSRALHLINSVFIGILSSMPRMWWCNDCAPGTEWLCFTKRKLPQEEGVCTSLMDELSWSPLRFPTGPRQRWTEPPLARPIGHVVGPQWLGVYRAALCGGPVGAPHTHVLGHLPEGLRYLQGLYQPQRARRRTLHAGRCPSSSSLIPLSFSASHPS